MPIDSPENALIFSVFQFLLAGLSVAASGWLLFVERHRSRAPLILSFLGFGLLALHYLANSHFHFFDLANQSNLFSLFPVLAVLRYANAVGFVLIAVAALSWRRLAWPVLLLVVSDVIEAQWWLGSMSLAILSLLASAFVIEKGCESIYFRFFVRLNTIFVAIALVLILITTHSERQQHLEYAAAALDDLTEYLRGHIIHYHRRGMAPPDILANPDIQRRIVSEFGRVPDLRRVRVAVKDHSIEMAIDEGGVIEYRDIGYALAPMSSESRYNRGEKLFNLISIPVYFNKEKLGLIEMDQTLLRINARLSRQIQVIFIAFTISVFTAFLVSGLIIREANKTIEEQCRRLRDAESQLMHASKLASIGQLADGIAHEINNPAGIILARADYLGAVANDNGLMRTIGSDIDVIRRQARRISSIVGDLLMFSRPSRLSMQPTDAVEVVSRTLKLLQPVIETRGICVSASLPRHPLVVSADPDRLEQVFVNVLQNAIDAMPRGGSIGIGATGNEDGTTLWFKDSGAGIDPENLDKIFDPFFTTKGNAGTGLGLSISYGIIRDHGGKIFAESTPGEGTTFSIFLPNERVRHEHEDSRRR